MSDTFSLFNRKIILSPIYLEKIFTCKQSLSIVKVKYRDKSARCKQKKLRNSKYTRYGIAYASNGIFSEILVDILHFQIVET